MGAGVYKSDCKGCKLSQGIEEPRRGGGIIELNGNWILNQYGGDEGFLGWMVLQPRFHRMELTDLNTSEVKALGVNIQNIDLALRRYWACRFEKDPIKRVYVVYFFESTGYHLHIHLIPRTKRFRSLSIRVPKTQGISKTEECRLIAWNIHKLSEHQDFPSEYRIREENEENRQKVEALTTYLRDYLSKLSAR